MPHRTIVRPGLTAGNAFSDRVLPREERTRQAVIEDDDLRRFAIGPKREQEALFQLDAHGREVIRTYQSHPAIGRAGYAQRTAFRYKTVTVPAPQRCGRY